MREWRKKEALEAIYQRREIQDIIEVEPSVVNILALAADPEPRENRWIAYEALKRMSSDFVGWDARSDALRTTEHYAALMESIDSLLPRPYEDEERRQRDEYV